MSSPTDAGSNAAGGLTLAPGQQALVSLPAVGSPYRALPAGASDRLLVVSSDAPRDVLESLEGAGIDPAGVAMVPVSGAPVRNAGSLETTEAVVPDDLTGLSMRLSECLEDLGPGGWVVFERVNVLVLYADRDRVVRFLDHVAAKIRENDLKGLFCVVRDAMDEQTFATLRRRVDAETDLR